MPLARWVRLASQVGSRRDLAPRICIAVVALVERLLGPVLVQAAIWVGAWQALAVGGLLSSIVALRTLLQSAHVARTESELYVRVVDSVLRQDVLQSSVLPNEEARAALFEGAHDVASLLGEGMPNLFANAVAAGTFAAFVTVTQPTRIVGAAFLACAIGVVLLMVSRRAAEATRQTTASAWVGLADGVSDAFDGRLEIVASGTADAYVRTFAAIALEWRDATRREARLARVAGRLPLLLLTLFVGAAVVLDSVLRGVPLGQSFGQAALLAVMSPAFVGIAHGWQELARSGRRLQHVTDLVAIPPQSSPVPKRPPGEVRLVELRDVHFSYAKAGRRREALLGASLSWRAGELLAIAGPNGSGKSTCLRLLLGLGEPSAGAVLVDGDLLERIDIDAWRLGIAFLPQRPYLPPRATVRKCLRFVDADLSDRVLSETLERVGLPPLLRDATAPLDLRIDELSVGQRQRVALARVLCRPAPLILLDEPDANLDQAGIQMVTSLVRQLVRDRMVILVAHSAELLAAADRVVNLDSGRLALELSGRSAPG
jgi:ABC-type transport system involved in cytochrome bd biosynthesis fused ATPase/permease subunit